MRDPASSKLIDFVVSTHPAYPKLLEIAKKTGKNTFEILSEKLEEMQQTRGAETLSSFRSWSGWYWPRLTSSSLD